jgi:hypothetical protein
MKRGRATAGPVMMPLDNVVLCLKMQASAIEEAGSDNVGTFIENVPGQDARALRFPGALLASNHDLLQEVRYSTSESTEASMEHNQSIATTFETVQKRAPFWKADTLTRAVTCAAGLALDVFIDVAGAYSSPANKGTDPATLYFKYAGASLLVKGGWATPYPVVRAANPSALSNQRNAVFHVEPKQVAALRKASLGLDALLNSTTKQVSLVSFLRGTLPQDNSPPQMFEIGGLDILFQMSSSVHFGEHRDDLAAHSAALRKHMALTVIWQVSPNGSSSLQLSGAPNAGKMNGPGEGHMFASNMYHRTEHTTAGTVKVAIFYTKVKSKSAKTAEPEHVKPVEEAAAAPVESPEATEDESSAGMPGPHSGLDNCSRAHEAIDSSEASVKVESHETPQDLD